MMMPLMCMPTYPCIELYSYRTLLTYTYIPFFHHIKAVEQEGKENQQLREELRFLQAKLSLLDSSEDNEKLQLQLQSLYALFHPFQRCKQSFPEKQSLCLIISHRRCSALCHFSRFHRSDICNSCGLPELSATLTQLGSITLTRWSNSNFGRDRT